MKVSVVTATWQRHDLLFERCMPSVAAQTMPVEHVIVADGPDPVLRDLLADKPVVYGEMDVHHTDPGTCAWGYNKGITVASGEYIGHCDDDNAWRPDHAALLSAALDANPDVDLAYSQIFRHGIGDVVGADPPFYGGIDGNALMYRRDLPERLGWWPTNIHAPDWHVVEKWMRGGIKWIRVPEVTVDFYYWPGTWGWRLAHGQG